jgi:hypothetical protein
MADLRIIFDGQKRQEYIDGMLANDGLSSIKEDLNAAYCPISLTHTPDRVKKYLLERQNILMDEVLSKAGIKAYDPSTAPYSPDNNLTSLPQEIYLVDSKKIVGARFFVGHDLTASTGFGVELEKASKFNRIAVILMDSNIRVSRMQSHRVIYLQYYNFKKQADEFVEVFKLLKEYDPGIGFEGREPVLIGLHRKTNEVVNLEKMIYQKFPKLKYNYDGQKSILDLDIQNPEIFYEYQNDLVKI